MLVVAAVLVREGRLLLCQRPRHKHHGGLWEFPGGKVDAGESLAGALARELDEELALDRVQVLGELHRHRALDRGLELVFFEVRSDGEPRCLEHEALAWVDPGAPLDLPLAPADREFFEKYRRLNQAGEGR